MLKRFSLLAFVIMACIAARAQYTVKVVIDAIPPKHPDDQIYLSGDFNNWSPNDPNTLFAKDGTGKFVLTVPNVPANSYLLKATRGTKETTECGGDGSAIPERKIVVNGDTTFHITVAGWLDDFPKTHN
jgi:hypothetical protein